MGIKKLIEVCVFYFYLFHQNKPRENYENRCYFTGKTLFRSNHRGALSKKGVLKNFAKFTGKHQRQSLFFNKVAGQACNFFKKRALAQVISCEFAKVLKTDFLPKTSGRLLTVVGILLKLVSFTKL